MTTVVVFGGGGFLGHLDRCFYWRGTDSLFVEVK
jgi:hypothetical protein